MRKTLYRTPKIYLDIIKYYKKYKKKIAMIELTDDPYKNTATYVIHFKEKNNEQRS